MFNSIDSIILHCALISNVGIETIKILVEKVGINRLERDIYHLTIADFRAYGFSEKKSKILYNGLFDKSSIEKELESIEQLKASFISYFSPDYPELLKMITSPPPLLYYLGAPFSAYKNTACCAIVGSRKGNYYARQVINHFVPEFVKNNIVIVSGGALGVDTMAHEATIQNNGKTIVVLGSGLKHLYPYQNKKLFEKIIAERGTIITPFSVETAPLSHNFPARNRIISGLSKAAVVVQAAEKSGAYITARYALDEGRDVFAVPGSVFDPLSIGCHELIKEGATVADSAQTILSTSFSAPSHLKKEPLSHEHSDPMISEILKNCLLPLFLEELIDTFDTVDVSVLQKKLCILQTEGKIKQELSGAFVTVNK